MKKSIAFDAEELNQLIFEIKQCLSVIKDDLTYLNEKKAFKENYNADRALLNTNTIIHKIKKLT